jgi:proline dehydrogenase
MRRLVEGTGTTRRVVNRFVAGETGEDALRVAARLARQGILTTLDVLGEGVRDHEGTWETTRTYVDLIHQLGDVGLTPDTEVSVKLSAIGQGMSGPRDTLAVDNAWTICEAAAAVGTTVTFDMEDHTTVDSSLGIAETLRRDFSWVGTVLQSNLRRTDGDLDALCRSAVRVRLVKGAYREPASVAYRSKAEVDEAYRRQLEKLFASRCYPMVATHDPDMIEAAHTAAQQSGSLPEDYEVQMLLGVRESAQRDLANQGRHLRVYVPFGRDWYRYFMRRLAERPANTWFFLRALAQR